MIYAEAPAAHRSPVTKPSHPRAHKPSKPTKPSTPATHKKHEAPTRSGGTAKRGKKGTTNKSAGLNERDVVEFDGGVLLHVQSLGTLPN